MKSYSNFPKWALSIKLYLPYSSLAHSADASIALTDSSGAPTFVARYIRVVPYLLTLLSSFKVIYSLSDSVSSSTNDILVLSGVCTDGTSYFCAGSSQELFSFTIGSCLAESSEGFALSFKFSFKKVL